MIQIVYANGTDERTFIDSMRLRAAETGTEINAAAAAILADVRANGIDAVQKYSLQFDKKEAYEISKEALDSAYDRIDPDLRDALTESAENIRIYHEKMLQSSWELNKGDGRIVGQRIRGLSRVGIYVPGGTAAYPSSVLMNAVPARVAGVEEIIMVTPPGKFLSDAVLAAAKIAGVDRVIAVGGVQAIAALSYGAGFIPRVDKIVGPGNAFVAAAKRQVFGTVDIDMVAGPSEVLVIADESADVTYVAADLLSQAEHDKLASAILVTDSEDLAFRVMVEIERQMAQLSRTEIMRASIDDFGAIIVCPDLKTGCAIANEIAPEHLEIVTKEPRMWLPFIKNAGAVFLGAYTPEPLGDYMAGPSHVLPTSGSARFFSPLSVDSFVKKMSVIEYTKDALLDTADKIVTVARSEQLTAHANSILVRMNKEN